MGDAGAFALANGAPLASGTPSRANKIRTEDEWRMALNALVGHEIYVYGTGTARELRQDGVLRKVPAAARCTARVRGPACK